MELRSIANSLTSQVLPNVIASVRISTGYTKTTGQKQVPTYASDVVGEAAVQALDNSDLKHIDGMNLQGDIRAIYLYGNISGVVRPDNKGGDLIVIADDQPVYARGTWLVTKVVESWPEWTKVVAVKQGGGQ